MTLDDANDMKIHQDIENAFTVLQAKHLLPRKELRERIEAFCEADREEDEARASRLISIIAEACADGDPD